MKNFSNFEIAQCLKNINNHKKFCNKVCQDAFFDLPLSTNPFKWKNSKTAVDYNKIKCNVSWILLILESPHTSEFFDEFGNQKNDESILAAEGSTYDNIRAYFKKHVYKKIMQKINNKSNYYLALINPIQFQTSEGMSRNNDNGLRDYNWLRMWNCCCNDFLERLGAFVKDANYNVIIINACTKSAYKQNIVNNSIKSNFNNIKLYKCNHPSYWDYKTKNNKSICSRIKLEEI